MHKVNAFSLTGICSYVEKGSLFELERKRLFYFYPAINKTEKLKHTVRAMPPASYSLTDTLLVLTNLRIRT